MAAVGTLICVGAWADPQDGAQWIAAMRDAGKTRNFHGTAVLLRDERVEMLELEHWVQGGVEHRAVRSLDDPDRESVNQSGRHSPMASGESRLGVSVGTPGAAMLMGMPCDDESYRRFYRTSLGGQERLIGRLAQEVVVESQDAYRYTRRYWVDTDSKLLLKLQIVNGGRILEQLVFSKLELDIPKEGEQNGEGNVESPVATQQRLPLDALQWRLEAVPPGFKLVSLMRHRSADNRPVEHLLLSDGLSSFSLYIEETDPSRYVKKQVRHMGPVHVYMRNLDNHRLIVMGEVPLATVIMVGDGVRPQESQ